MSFLLLIYASILILLGYVLYFITKRKLHYAYEKYLTIGIICQILWIFFYMSLFLFKVDSGIDIYRVKILYGLGFIFLYIMLAFFYFYGLYDYKNKLYYRYFHIWFSVFLGAIFSVIMFTDKMVSSIEYHPVSGESYDVLGPWYVFLESSHVLSIILLIIIVIYRRYRLSGIYKMRYSYIAVGYFITILFQVIFLSVLPSSDIFILQREQIIFFLPFLAGILYSMHRYQFRKISFGIGRASIFIFSGILAIFLTFALRRIFMLLDHNFLTFWNLNNNISLGDIVVGNILFYLIHRYMQTQFKLYYDSSFALQKQLSGMQTQIPFLQNSGKLNKFLKSQFFRKMRISDAKIFTGNDLSKMGEVVQYFQSGSANNFFLNDIVFVEENKHKFSKHKAMKQLDPNVVLYIPMYKKKEEVLGILCVGRKPFGDDYRMTEIDLLQNFASFLTGHLTYMNIYSKINELNLTLDKKVDEKTIEYNNLINRQKEFIAYVGHEIRNPITNTIFLCYDLQEKIAAQVGEDNRGEELKEDIEVLSGELKKVSDLSKEIFTTEKIDLGKTKLYKSSINLREFILSEISVLEINNPNVVFNHNIRDIGMMDIDEIQFRQVIQNLLGNALKFIPQHRGKISIDMKEVDHNNVCITIEDNGKGFSDVSNANVFDKYRTGSHESSGLGMGLYLCKKIVELHGGNIESSKSSHLGGAQFTIIL